METHNLIPQNYNEPALQNGDGTPEPDPEKLEAVNPAIPLSPTIEQQAETHKVLEEIEHTRASNTNGRDRTMGLDFLIAEIKRDVSLLTGEIEKMLQREDEDALVQSAIQHPESDRPVSGSRNGAESVKFERPHSCHEPER